MGQYQLGDIVIIEESNLIGMIIGKNLKLTEEEISYTIEILNTKDIEVCAASEFADIYTFYALDK